MRRALQCKRNHVIRFTRTAVDHNSLHMVQQGSSPYLPRTALVGQVGDVTTPRAADETRNGAHGANARPASRHVAVMVVVPAVVERQPAVDVVGEHDTVQGHPAVVQVTTSVHDVRACYVTTGGARMIVAREDATTVMGGPGDISEVVAADSKQT